MSPELHIITAAVALAVFTVAYLMELERDLMMFQQNSYRAERYRKWLSESKDTTSLWRLSALVTLFIGLSTLSRPMAAMLLTVIVGIAIALNLKGRRYKKPIVWTARAKRIYGAAVVLTVAVEVAAIALFGHGSAIGILLAAALTMTGCYCASHIMILLANLCLSPVEHMITRHYYNDAKRRLESMPGLKIIGITGSYGKTSTKHYLHRILSEQFDTLMTPGSFNTTLGVVRTIREYMKPYNEVFIVEMGAKNPGDIKEICDLVHPTTGIITAVGPQHLESFKTIERVQATKFELADALPADGTAIVNNDFEKIADRPVNNCRCLRYAVTAPDDTQYRATNVKYSPEGTEFTVEGPDGFSLALKTQLMGECNVSDLLAAIVCARTLGVPDKKIASAVASIEPVEHRLSVKRTPGGITILDDAFNSNPVGSRMALEVLGAMRDGKRIVITPGMIELGSEQYELNREFGETISRNVDVAIVVGRYNREAIAEGIRDTGILGESNIHLVDTFKDAQTLLASIAAKGDTVLYENDLPDTFK